MIYADNAATTRISDRAFEEMLPFLRSQYGNASSQYLLGARAKHAIEHARKQIAAAIGAEPPEITFTSGGSETNSWVMRYVAERYCNEPTHIITSAIEHHSVLNACHALEQKGIEVTYIPVDSLGLISVDDIREAIQPHTKLVSIMFANNEIGTIQPVAKIGRFLKDTEVLFHTDAVQAVGNILVDVNELQVDFLTASAHKFNGAKGMGFLYFRKGIEMSPMVFGGEQEHGCRGGTENVASIVAGGCAVEESVNDIAVRAKVLEEMVDQTVKGIKKIIPNVRINGDYDNRLPGIINLSFGSISGESLMHILDTKGVCVSTSSACNTGEDKPSHVLIALGLTEQQAKSAIRISYGKYNHLDEVATLVDTVCDAYAIITSNL